MMLRNRVAFAAIAFTVLAGTAACGRIDIGGGPVALPAADTSSVEPHDVVASPVPEAPGTGVQAREVVQKQPDSSQAPVPKPTVAKTQRWVKIYSGVSDQEIEPPKDPAKGSRTVELNATTSELFGTYVADGRGMTLYRFDNDSAKPPRATCNGDCAKTWPPLLIKSPGKIFPSGDQPQRSSDTSNAPTDTARSPSTAGRSTSTRRTPSRATSSARASRTRGSRFRPPAEGQRIPPTSSMPRATPGQ